MTKKVLKQKNVFLNREILTKNLATFKRWHETKDEKF